MATAAAIRRLTSADVECYRTIRLATLAREPEFFAATHATEATRPLQDFAETLASSTVFGAFDGSDIVGVVRWRPEGGAKERHKGVIQGFFVEPESRRRRIGAGLMTAVIDAARLQVEQLTLRVVRENTAAIALYRRFGFETYGIEPRARRTANGYADIVMMVLFLGSDRPE